MDVGKTLKVKNHLEWRSWLAKHHADTKEIWLVYYKKASGKSGLTYEESVLEGVAYGWIEGQIKSIDEDTYAARFTPRRPKSKWSASHIAPPRHQSSGGGLMTLHVVEHPLVAHYLTRLRDRDTTPDEFREASDKIITLLLYEATRDLRTRDFSIDTPLEKTQGHAIGDRVVAVPILRAGLGLVGPVLELLPHVTVGYIGLERDERTAIASRYYVKLPPDIAGKSVMILDPMLATGGTATKAVEIMKEYHPASVRLVCVVAAPEGIQALLAAHPDVQIFTAARDRELNAQKYILPGLGDYGDRLFGT